MQMVSIQQKTIVKNTIAPNEPFAHFDMHIFCIIIHLSYFMLETMYQ